LVAIRGKSLIFKPGEFFNMMRGPASFLALAIFVAFQSASFAAIEFGQNVTSNAIYGGGNDNGSFTTDRNLDAGVELGLRAKQRFPPANVFNNSGLDNDYFHAAGNDAGRPLWSFEWSINSNYNGNGGVLSGLTYLLRLDSDPGVGTDFLSFDPINSLNPNTAGGYWDHSIGDNSTGQSAGVEAANAGQYATLISGNNLAQNSWRMDFFFLPVDFDPNIDGTYTFTLSAIGATGARLATTSIDVIVGDGAAVPEPLSFLAWGGLIGCAAVAARRHQRS
jgi:hypothetical protein